MTPVAHLSSQQVSSWLPVKEIFQKTFSNKSRIPVLPQLRRTKLDELERKQKEGAFLKGKGWLGTIGSPVLLHTADSSSLAPGGH
jgi:hypothetical protein